MSARRSPDDVAIFCGPAGNPWAPADPETRGLGGSETVAVRIAEGLTALGLSVAVYAETDAAEHAGVAYLPWQAFDPCRPRLAVVASRRPELFELGVNARRRLFLAQDAHHQRVTPAAARATSAVLAVSTWHARLLAARHPELASKVVAIRNGVDHDRFAGPAPARRRRVLFSSAPNRGLDVLAALWPHVRTRVPDAELAWCYQPGYAPFADRMRRFAQGDGIVELGPRSQTALAQELRASLVWTTPSWWSDRREALYETSCIAAIEAQAAGAHVVASGWGALTETVQVGTLVPGPAGSAEWAGAFADALVAGLTDPVLQRRAQREGPRAVADWDWDGVARDVLAVIEGGVGEGRTVLSGQRRRPRPEAASEPERRLLPYAVAGALGAAAAAVVPAPAHAAVTAVVTQGTLTVTSDAGDSILVTCDGSAQVLVNAVPPVPPAACASLTGLVVNGGPSANTVELGAVSGASFPALVSDTTPKITVSGNGGGDSLFGSPLRDLLSETLPAAGAYTLTPLSFIGGGVADTISSFERAAIRGTSGDDSLDASTFRFGVAFDALAGNDALLSPFDPNDAEVSSSFTAGEGDDRLSRTFNAASMTLTNTLAQIPGAGGDVALSSVEGAQITGGDATNALFAQSYLGHVTFTAGGGSDTLQAPGDPNQPGTAHIFDGGPGAGDFVSILGGGDFAATPSLLSGRGSVALTSVEAVYAQADVNDNPNTFDASLFKGEVLFNSSGGDDCLILTDPNEPPINGFFNAGAGSDCLEFTTNAGAGVVPGTVPGVDFILAGTREIDLDGVDQISVVGGPAGNTYSFGPFTGGAFIDAGGGDDTIGAPGDPNQPFTRSPFTDRAAEGPYFTILRGGEGNDSITGSSKSDSISGGAGNDTISALAGDDLIDGGAGADTINCGGNADVRVIDAADIVADCPAVAAPSPTPSPTPSATVTPTAKDTLAPRIRVTVANRSAVPRSGSLSVIIAGEARIGVKAAQAADPAFRGTVTVTGPGTAKATLGKASYRGAEGKTTRVKVKLKRSVRKKLAKAGKLKVKVVVTARDAAGNSTKVTRAVTLKPKK